MPFSKLVKLSNEAARELAREVAKSNEVVKSSDVDEQCEHQPHCGHLTNCRHPKSYHVLLGVPIYSQPSYSNPEGLYYPSIRRDSFGRTLVLLNRRSSSDVYSIVPMEQVASVERIVEPLRIYRSSHGIMDATTVAILLPTLVLLALTLGVLSKQMPLVVRSISYTEQFSGGILKRFCSAALGAVLSSLLAILGFSFGSL